MNNEEIKNLIREVLNEREQQITYPIDDISKTIIDKDNILYSLFSSGTTTNNGYIVCKINGQTYEINVKQI